MKPVIVTANLIVGKDGSTSISGSSTPLSTQEDRERFQALRLKNDLILIGGNTARREPYKRTPIPLYILTHTKVRLQPKNQLAKQFLMPPAQLFKEISENFPPTDDSSAIRVLVEAGPSLLQSLIDQGLIDHLHLTTNLVKEGENRISVEKLTSSFKLISQEIIEEAKFERYKKI